MSAESNKPSVVLGAQWGDEGKGKFVDILASEHDVVVRFQGGNNAGHTLVVENDEGEKVKTVLHLIPSGILQEDTVCVIAAGVVLDPLVLKNEIVALEKAGVKVTPENFVIASDATVIMPYHVALDKAREEFKGAGKIGTTGRGIGPCYEDKAARRSIFARDLLNPDVLLAKVTENLNEKNALLSFYGEGYKYHPELIVDSYLSLGTFLKPFVQDTDPVFKRFKAEGKRVLFEGAQGTMLDVGLGTYPYVTSSHTTSGGVCVSTGLAPSDLGTVYGVTKAYATRVGGGPFPTELFDEAGDHLQTTGSEFGATTGRPRRCGWLDLPALKYAVRVNGITSLVLTKLDILSGLSTVKVCYAYEDSEGNIYEEPPRDTSLLETLTPLYLHFDGWSEDITKVKSFGGLPQQAQAFISYIELTTGVDIEYVSVGPERASIFKKPSTLDLIELLQQQGVLPC